MAKRNSVLVQECCLKGRMTFYSVSCLALLLAFEAKSAQVSQPNVPGIGAIGPIPDNYGRVSSNVSAYSQDSQRGRVKEKGAPIPITVKGRKITPHEHAAQGEESTITIDRLNLTGLTAYSQEEAREFFQPLLGKPCRIKDFVKASERLIHKYWDDGYVLAEAELRFKEFQPDTHEATIHLYEGQIKKTSLKGGDEGIRTLISTYIDLWKDTKPFRTEVLQQYNSLTNYIPGLTIWGKTRPIDNDPGAGSIELTVQQKKIQAFAIIDNRGSKFVAPYRGVVGAYAMSTFKDGDVSSFMLSATPSKELSYGRVSYVLPLNYEGDSILVKADYGKVQPGFILKGDNIVQHDFSFEALYQHLTFAVPGHQIVLKAGLDAFVNDAKGSIGRIYADQIREVILGISDSFTDPLKGKNLLELLIYQGFTELGGKNRPSSLRSEPDGRADATRFVGEWSHSQPLPNRFSVVLSTRGQYSFQPLLQATSFFFGGYPYGSAYDPGEISGDHGLSGRLEGRYAFEATGYNHVYLFYDAGKVWNRKISSGYRTKSGTSTGVGTRLFLGKNYEADFELAKPLTLRLRSVLANGTSRPWRFFFRLTARF